MSYNFIGNQIADDYTGPDLWVVQRETRKLLADRMVFVLSPSAPVFRASDRREYGFRSPPEG
jgi:hypothetical protein